MKSRTVIGRNGPGTDIVPETRLRRFGAAQVKANRSFTAIRPVGKLKKMRYNLKDIDAFLKVAEIGSITQAAARSNTAKSILSKRISDLEDALGAQLIHRSTRGVKLTDKGLIFYERARASVHQLDEAFDELTDNSCSLSGTLRITAPVSFGTRYLGPILVRRQRS
jgi:DNA-binding transcriptional LysR family regulator